MMDGELFFFFSEHIRRASTLLTQHHGYQVPFRPGFSPKRVLHTKNDAAKKKIRTVNSSKKLSRQAA